VIDGFLEKHTFMNHLYYAYKSLFFSLERKEPKVQDCQKKSENSTVRVTEILKLVPTGRDSNSQNFYVTLTGIFTDFF